MTVMGIAIVAIVTAFTSGTVALNRASQASTAATLADIEMEGFRRKAYGSITPTCAAGAAADAFCPSAPVPKTGPDGRNYQIKTAIRFDCGLGTLGGTVPSAATCTPVGPATLASRPAKLVTVVVEDPTATELFRETSTFDQATG